MKKAIYPLLTAMLFGLAGCGNSIAVPSPTNKNTQQELSVTNKVSSSQTPPNAVINSIQLQPGGILIKLDRNATPLQQIVSSSHLSHAGLEYSFSLKNVVDSQLLSENQESGNQLIRRLDIRKQSNDLLVTLQLLQTVNKFTIGTSGPYIGIALQYLPPHPMPSPHSVGKIPSWFMKDMLIAATSEGKPVQTDTYGGSLPFGYSDKTYMLKAPFNFSQEEVGFSAYFGAISLYDNYSSLLQNPPNSTLPFLSVTYGRIRERENGKWNATSAIMVNMQNGWDLGFAHNQVIVESEHAGVLMYTVYPVQGIELGTPFK